MINTYKKIFQLLLPEEGRKMKYLFILMIMASFFELLAAASIMPFIVVISDPTIIEKKDLIFFLFNVFSFKNNDSFIIALGCLVFILVIIGNGFRAFTQYSIARFVHSQTSIISTRMLEVYFHKPYSWFLNKDIPKLENNLLIETHKFSAFVLLPALQIVVNSTVSLFFALLLFYINPTIAFFSIVFVGGTYAMLYRFLRKKRANLGKERMSAQSNSFKIVKESLGGIKEVKVFGLEKSQIKKFSNSAKSVSEKIANIQITAEMPGYIFQGIAFGGIVAILLIMKVFNKQEMSEILPLLAVYAYSGLRLAPSFQKIYVSLTHLNTSKPIIEEIESVLLTENYVLQNNKVDSNHQKLLLTEKIQLANISFKYKSSSTPVFENVDLTIRKNSQIGFMGTTGAGKTTMLDIFLGLLPTDSGEILIDDVLLSADNLRSWQTMIGYVPQFVFLLDDSIAVNIAFGIPDEEIDIEKVKMAAKAAQLDGFIENELKNGYYTRIGERGVRLSGGQRQRLGLARALYREPSILILDEATNALDKTTEESILNNLCTLVKTKTIIIVSHHIDTLKYCDDIFMFEKGKIRQLK